MPYSIGSGGVAGAVAERMATSTSDEVYETTKSVSYVAGGTNSNQIL